MVDFEYKEIKKRFFHNGVELASFFAKYPYAEGYEKISDFYGLLAENSYAWFCGEFIDRCREECEGTTDKLRRFERESYRYTAEFLAKEEGELLLVSCDIVLKKGRRDILREWHELHAWDGETGLLVRQKKKSRV